MKAALKTWSMNYEKEKKRSEEALLKEIENCDLEEITDEEGINVTELGLCS